MSEATDRAREMGKFVEKVETLEVLFSDHTKEVKESNASMSAEIKNLASSMSKGIKVSFESLDCKANTEKITEVFKWYEDHKELKMFITKRIIQYFVMPTGAILLGYTLVSAYIKG